MDFAPPILVCALAVAGLLVAEYRDSRAGLWLTKPLASAAFVWLAVAAGALASTYGRLVLLALLLCLLGDLLLIPRDQPFSAAFLTRPLDPAGLLAGAVVLALLIGWVLRWLGRSLPPDMVIPVRVYMLVIGVMSALACGATAAGGPVLLAIGALAFTASDISVARDRFVRHQFINRAWGLPLYYAAQLLLAMTPALT